MSIKTLQMDSGAVSWDSGTGTISMSVTAGDCAESLETALFLLGHARHWAWEDARPISSETVWHSNSIDAPEHTPVWTSEGMFAGPLSVMRKEEGVWFCCGLGARTVLSGPMPEPKYWAATWNTVGTC